jgi:hypothetical protein
VHVANIAVGKSYVNESARVIREVVAEICSLRVQVRTFELVTGRLIPARRQVCRKTQLARWADRETSIDEKKRVHPFDAATGLYELPSGEAGSASLESLKINMARAVGGHPPQKW